MKNKTEIEVLIAPTSSNAELSRTLKCGNLQSSGFVLYKSPLYYAVGYIIFNNTTGTIGYMITDIQGWDVDLFKITQIYYYSL